MHRTRSHWPTAAGLLLAAAASPATAQNAPAKVLPPPDAPANGVMALPAPRPADAPAPAPTAPAETNGAPCATPGPGGGWQQWRSEHHARCQANMWGYPEEFDAPPLGASVHAHYRGMVANGEAAGMVLYRYDFLCDAAKLNMHGYDRLARMAAYQAEHHQPIVIERTPELPTLAEARRAAVLSVLAKHGHVVSPDLVIIGSRWAVGLPGDDAVRIYGSYLNNLTVQGQPVSPLSSGGTGIVTSGGSGGGAFGATATGGTGR
jgi:hypothetical protein